VGVFFFHRRIFELEDPDYLLFFCDRIAHCAIHEKDRENMGEKKRKRDAQEANGDENGVQEVKKAKRGEKYKRQKEQREQRRAERGVSAGDEKEEKRKRKQEKRERKERKLGEKGTAVTEVNGEDGEKKEKKKKSKKDKKDKSTVAVANGSDNETTGGVPLPSTNEPTTEPTTEPTEEEARDPKSQRFIVFIGNLPYTATVSSVTAHFSKISPTQIRIPMEKNHKEKAKGFGFLEFEAYDRMKTCLKLYHHSSFDDGKSPARRINVELTYVLFHPFSHGFLYTFSEKVVNEMNSAGGGGSKSVTRKEKLKEKNSKLEKERAREAKELMKKNKKKEANGGSGGGEAAKQEEDLGPPKVEEVQTETDFGDVHPSRRSRMGGR
jgi:nucleolar protein 6